MAIEDGAWIMRGLDWDNPARIQSWKELIGWIDEIGFLPLFKNEVDGFSAEENTSDLYWWTGDEEQDSWEWRRLIARSGRVAYGKFFGGKAGFISRAWFPHFANWRRDGYDFDSRWDEELAPMRGSKYVQSDLGDTFSQVKALLDAGTAVLFSGVPCPRPTPNRPPEPMASSA